MARTRPFAEGQPARPARRAPPEALSEPSLEQRVEESEIDMRANLRVATKSDVAPIEPTVANTPAAVVPLDPLPPLPPAPPPLGAWTWTRLIGPHSAVHRAALRREPGGFTLVGDRVLESLSAGEIEALERLEERLAEADRRAPPLPVSPPSTATPTPTTGAPPAAGIVRTYQLADETTGAPIEPSVAGTFGSQEFQARHLNGDLLRCRVLRLRTEG